MEWADIILLTVKLVGTAAFSVSGALIAIEKQLDIFGALVLGVITALGGGVFRDILLGITPPLMFQQYTFIAVALITSFLVFWAEYFLGPDLDKHRHYYLQVINLFDAIGLGVFSVVGVNTVIECGYGDNWFLAVFIGATTGITGGIFRDVLAGRIPMVLYKQVYALASITGATLFYTLYQAGQNATMSMFAGAASVILIRLLATTFRWSLPRVRK